MSSTLERQIRDLTQAFEASIDPVTVEEISGSIELATDASALRQRPAWLAAVAVAAIVLAPLIIVGAMWLDDETAHEVTPTTIDEATTTTLEATTTTVGSDAEQPVTPAIGVAGLPVGWTVAELTLVRNDGRAVVGYGAQGVPFAMTHGFHCQDESGVTRINRAASSLQGEGCAGDVVEDPVATFYRAHEGEWTKTVDPFGGNPSHPVNRLANLASVIVCAAGEPLPFEPDTCQARFSDDGTEWFTPVLADEDGVTAGTDGAYFAEALWGVAYSPHWHRVDDQILSAVYDTEGGRRTPDSVTWFYSPDGGRTFTLIGNERAPFSEYWGNSLSFVYRGRFRSIIWDDQGNATVRELSDELTWTPIGPVVGLPAPQDEYVPGESFGQSAQGTKAGTVYLMNPLAVDRGSERPVPFISADGGATWTEPGPTVELPFATAGDPYVGDPRLRWSANIDGWLLMSTDRGLLLTDGRDWYTLDPEVFISGDVTDRRVSGSTTVRIPVPPQP